MSTGFKHKVKEVLRSRGFDIQRFDPLNHLLARKRSIFESFRVDLVLDVGANTGQFGESLRQNVGYSGRIVSFEPLSSAYRVLKEKALKDPRWEALNFALGDRTHKAQMHVSSNSVSSSLLDMLPAHSDVAPDSRYVGTEMVEIKTLDAIFSTLQADKGSIYLKVDTQGSEQRVLMGAKRALGRIHTVELEMSLEPLYKGETSFQDMYDLLRSRGYRMVFMEPVYFEMGLGPIMQINGIFHRF